MGPTPDEAATRNKPGGPGAAGHWPAKAKGKLITADGLHGVAADPQGDGGEHTGTKDLQRLQPFPSHLEYLRSSASLSNWAVAMDVLLDMMPDIDMSYSPLLKTPRTTFDASKEDTDGNAAIWVERAVVGKYFESNMAGNDFITGLESTNRVLRAAMCALAAGIAIPAAPVSVFRKYFDEARRELMASFEKPSFESLQAALVMANLATSHARVQVVDHLTGVAVRLPSPTESASDSYPSPPADDVAGSSKASSQLMMVARIACIIYDATRQDREQLIAAEDGSDEQVFESRMWLNDLTLERHVVEWASEIPPIARFNEEQLKVLKGKDIVNPWHLRSLEEPAFKNALDMYMEGKAKKPVLWEKSFVARVWDRYGLHILHQKAIINIHQPRVHQGWLKASLAYRNLPPSPPNPPTGATKKRTSKPAKPTTNSAPPPGAFPSKALESRRLEHALRRCLQSAMDGMAGIRSIGMPRSRGHPDYALLGAVNGPLVITGVFLGCVCFVECLLLIGWANVFEWRAMRNDPHGQYLLDISFKERWDMLKQILFGLEIFKEVFADKDFVLGERSTYNASGNGMFVRFLDATTDRYWAVLERIEHQDLMEMDALFAELEPEEVGFLQIVEGVLMQFGQESWTPGDMRCQRCGCPLSGADGFASAKASAFQKAASALGRFRKRRTFDPSEAHQHHPDPPRERKTPMLRSVFSSFFTKCFVGDETEVDSKSRLPGARYRSRRTWDGPQSNEADWSKTASIDNGADSRPIEHPSTSPCPRTTNLLTNRSQCPVLSGVPIRKGIGCSSTVCESALMVKSNNPVITLVAPESSEVESDAIDFLTEYYRELKLSDAERDQRIRKIRAEIKATGTYVQTLEELTFGARTSWRNASRCILRAQWNTLIVRDLRHVDASEGMIEGLLEHNVHAWNGNGQLRSVATIFAPLRPGLGPGPRIWNPQLVRYAGYRMADGTVVGDPAMVEFTDICIAHGWKPRFGRFDILPLMVTDDPSDKSKKVVMREYQPGEVQEVAIFHPSYPWFAELGLKWHAIPAISNMGMTIGGVQYPAVAFSGWYMSAEIAARNLADTNRYNVLPLIAERMGLDVNSTRTLWKDEALVVLNRAVIHSFDAAGVTIVDHHTASDSFATHYSQEIRKRGHCPADWVWITPPISGSTTKVFHQEMLNYFVKPAILPLEEPAHVTYSHFHDDKTKSSLDVSRSVESVNVPGCYPAHPPVFVFFASETGTSEALAEEMVEQLTAAGVAVESAAAQPLDPTSFAKISSYPTSCTVLLVTSTTGAGEVPSQAVPFMASLTSTSTPFTNLVRFGVFGLGSSIYSGTVNRAAADMFERMERAGGIPIAHLGFGDDVGDRRASMQTWARGVVEAIKTPAEHHAPLDPTAALRARLAAHRQLLSTFTAVPLARREMICSVPGREVLFLELDISGSPFEYAAGDLLMVATTNPDEYLDASYMWPDSIPTEDLRDLVDLRKLATQQPGEPLTALPLLQPRAYSISSSGTGSDRSVIHLTVGVFPSGLCSSRLLTQPFGSLVRVKHVASRFQLTPTLPALSHRVVAIAAGTGIAPIRGFWRLPPDQRLPLTLVFGARDRAQLLYAEEMERAVANGALRALHVAFSAQGRRVQDVIREDQVVGEELAEGIVSGKVTVFVCGSSRVGASVHGALVDLVAERRGMGVEAAEEILRKRKTEGLYVVDTFSA
ncbi:Nitric oxide synthase, inducible [Phlyctochytrium bullatum]|nr:Nitric oxide synthase, inducible [Phlyctochytrium bullatum]